jgi:hypothetical protein
MPSQMTGRASARSHLKRVAASNNKREGWQILVFLIALEWAISSMRKKGGFTHPLSLALALDIHV